MRIHVRTSARRGVILPYVAISMVALLGFIALAIDLGMVMVAKTQDTERGRCGRVRGSAHVDRRRQSQHVSSHREWQGRGSGQHCAGHVRSGGERYHDARRLPLRPHYANFLSAISAGRAGQL